MHFLQSCFSKCQIAGRRIHNLKAAIPCPENCGRLFTNKTIKKHILSHKPEHHWPFVCLACGKHLQAKSDLVKHLQTKQHVEDSRIPKAGTQEFKEFIKRSNIQLCDFRNQVPNTDDADIEVTTKITNIAVKNEIKNESSDNLDENEEAAMKIITAMNF